MATMPSAQRREIAAAELAQHSAHLQAAPIVDALSLGLTQLRALLVKRIHSDVQHDFGVDTMIGPVSSATEVKQVMRAGLEIDVYLSIVAYDEVQRGGYVEQPAEWFLDWLTRLRLDGYDSADVKRRIEIYRGLTSDECRRGFVASLQRVSPESLRTPLVLFRLAPLAARIVAATAFGDAPRTEQLRAEQREILPAIGFCNDCQGRLLGNSTDCPRCGNPIWNFDWLREA